jgi:hypothetical protein
MEDILNIGSRPEYSEGIVGMELHTHQPYYSKSFVNGDEIRISIHHQDICTAPGRSFLHIEGKLQKSDGGSPSKNFTLTNNAFAFLFDEVRYELNNVEIARVRNVGTTSTLKGYASFSAEKVKSLQNSGWLLPKGESELVSDKGDFNACIPLSALLGFFEDYDRILYGVKQELVLFRSRKDANAILQFPNSAETNDPRIEINSVSWRIHHVSLSDRERLRLLDFVNRGETVVMPFRNWELCEYPQLPQTTEQTWAIKTMSQLEKPRFVILAFQTDRKDMLKNDSSVFDHNNLTDVKLYLNSTSFPYNDLNLDFENGRFGLLYEMYRGFQEAYYPDRDSNSPLLSVKNFKDIAPLVVIDCSKQNEQVKTGPVDIRLEFKSKAAFPDKTTAYCVIIHDRVVEYNPLTGEVQRVV